MRALTLFVPLVIPTRDDQSAPIPGRHQGVAVVPPARTHRGGPKVGCQHVCRYLATGGTDGFLLVYDLQNGSQVRRAACAVPCRSDACARGVVHGRCPSHAARHWRHHRQCGTGWLVSGFVSFAVDPPVVAFPCQVLKRQLADGDAANGVAFHPYKQILCTASGQRHFRLPSCGRQDSEGSSSEEEARVAVNELALWEVANL